jgi:TldD protein
MWRTQSRSAQASGCYERCRGFAASNRISREDIIKTAERAVAVAKANAKISSDPVQLAPQQGYGEVSWKTPIQKNAFEIPVKEKVDLLLQVNGIAMQGGANFINSAILAVNEQKYFASTDGSYIDQDVHRIYPFFNVTKIDKATGKFETRRSLSSPLEWVMSTERRRIRQGNGHRYAI